MFLTNTQVLRPYKAFANGSSANVKSSKNQLHKIGQSGGILGRILGPLLKTRLSLMKNVMKPLAKSVLIPLWLTPAASAIVAAICKKNFQSGPTLILALRPLKLVPRMTTFIISNEEMNYIMKKVKSLE